MFIVLLFLFAPLAQAHFIWFKYNQTQKQLICTFSEHAGQPGLGMLLDMISDKINGHSEKTTNTNATVPHALTFQKVNTTTSMAQLVAPVVDSFPLILEGMTTFGIFQEPGHSPSLLKYYYNADVPTRPNDWFNIQKLSTSPFEITLRDPYMATTLQTTNNKRIFDGIYEGMDSINDSNGACPTGTPYFKNEFCVVAVVRWNGTLIGQTASIGAVNVTTFGVNGHVLDTQETTSGVVILRFPNTSIPFFAASVNYKEYVGGTYEGKKYNYVDHWATTTSFLQR